MRLYLVRHGEAVSKDRDPARPLTDAGAARARRIGRFLRDAGVDVGEIRYSTKLRARQTAELVADAMGLGALLREVAGLEPEAGVDELADALAQESTDVMLVGHLPHLARLASLLVAGDPDREAFAFEDCGVLCLGRAGTGTSARWAVRWMVVPSLFERSPPE